jgi:hypothetical protein
MRTGRMSVNGRVLGPEEPCVSGIFLFIVIFWLKQNSQTHQKDQIFIEIQNVIFPSISCILPALTEHP